MTGGKHTLCWDDVSYGAVLKMAQLTQEAHYIEGIKISLDFLLPNGGVTYTPGGWDYCEKDAHLFITTILLWGREP